MERAPLLPQADQSYQESLIFEQVCHSPWRFLTQSTLVFIRGILAVYTTAVLALSLLHDLQLPTHGQLFAFDARNLSFLGQTSYFWITAVTTYSVFELNYFWADA